MKDYDQETGNTTKPRDGEVPGFDPTWYDKASESVEEKTGSETARDLIFLAGVYTNPGTVVGAAAGAFGSTATPVDPATATVGGGAVGSTAYRMAQHAKKGNLEYEDLANPGGLAFTTAATGVPTAAAAGATYAGRNIEEGVEVAQEGADAASESAEASMEVVDTLLSGAADAVVGASNEAGKALSQYGPELADQAPEVTAGVVTGLTATYVAATYAAIIYWDNYEDDDF